ncbi:MAG: hypothetical protein ABWY55_10030 [Microbacterium sp.]
MTAIHAPRTLSRTTRFERILLQTAAGLDHLVAERLERRSARAPRPVSPQAVATDARADALALGSNGILPR